MTASSGSVTFSVPFLVEIRSRQPSSETLVRAPSYSSINGGGESASAS